MMHNKIINVMYSKKNIKIRSSLIVSIRSVCFSISFNVKKRKEINSAVPILNDRINNEN